MPPSKRKVTAMDPKFPDRMAELGDVSSETLNARWNAVVSITSAAVPHVKGRLVLLACREHLDRDADEWFLKPFREAEDNFRVDDAAELHSRLAEAAARHLISQGDELTPMLVRLAVLSGRTLVSGDLAEDAASALHETLTEVLEFVPSRAFWTKANQDEIKVEGGANPVILSNSVDRVAVNSQNGIAELGKQVAALTEWAAEAERRFGAEQQMIQWLLGGVRDDGTAWTKLSPSAIAVDAAVELSAYVFGPPQPRHEAILAQVLSVSGVDEKHIKPKADDIEARFNAIDDKALAELAPITHALATGGEPARQSPYDIARRVLWETSTTKIWAAE